MGITTLGYLTALQEQAEKRSTGHNEPFYPKHFPKNSAATLSAKLREQNIKKTSEEKANKPGG